MWKSNASIAPRPLALGRTNQHLAYWSDRALTAEKKIKAILKLIQSPDKEVKRLLMFDEIASQ